MTSEYDDQGKQVRDLRQMACNRAKLLECSAAELPEWKAADTITRLTRENAEAHAQGAEEMRKAALTKCRVAFAVYKCEASEASGRVERSAEIYEHTASVVAALTEEIAALPLPSPMAAQAVEPWVEKVREKLTAIIESNPEAYDQCCGGGVQIAYDEPLECCNQPIRENAGQELAREALALLPKPTGE